MHEIGYDRGAAVDYAKRWAMARNPAYLDFEAFGGDCTNFASQCIFAGCHEMNYTRLMGWFYITAQNRTPSWTGVEFLHNFLVANKQNGPYAQLAPISQAQPGDIIQLGTPQRFYHSPVVVSVEQGRIFVAAHSADAWMRPLDSYQSERMRLLHILGARRH